MTVIVAYLATAVVFFAIDAVWLGLVATTFYADQLGALMRDRPDFAIAGAFYALYVVGIVVFAVRPALETGRLGAAAWRGALLGLIAYGTYDLTNLATLAGWPVLMSVVDMLWGTALTAVSATLGLAATRRFARRR